MKRIYTYGVFDLLHPGHIRLLERAKALGDYLIVGIVDDLSVKKLKGNDRPILNQQDRANIIAALKCVDEILLQNGYDPSLNLKAYPYKIDILTKGDDWDYIPGTETIKDLGGQLIKLSYTQEHSTSAMVRKIKNDIK